MKTIIRTGFLAALCLGGLAQAEPCAAPATLAPYRAEYEVLQDGKPAGHASVELARDGAGQWTFTTHTRGENGLAGAAGLDVRETSRFAFEPQHGGFRSIDYRYQQKALWRSRERSVAFSPERGEILSRDRDKEYRFAYRADALDRQAVTLALACDLAQGKRDHLHYAVADRERLSEQGYTIAATESVQTPAGTFPALRIERERGSDERRHTASWLSPAHGHAPVRVVQTESDGSRFEMRLLQFTASAGISR